MKNMTFVWDTSGDGVLSCTGTNHKERRRRPSSPALCYHVGTKLGSQSPGLHPCQVEEELQGQPSNALVTLKITGWLCDVILSQVESFNLK